VRPDPGGEFDESALTGFRCFKVLARVTKYLIGQLIGWQRYYRHWRMGGRLFRHDVVAALALCNHSLTLIYVDVSMRRRRVKI
jgi:hypothetical protein